MSGSLTEPGQSSPQARAAHRDLWQALARVRRARQSVRGKVMGVVLLTTTMSLLVAGAAMLTHDLTAYRRSWASDLAVEASILAHSTTPALAFDDPEAARAALEALEARPEVLVAALYGSQGKLYARYTRSGQSAAPTAPTIDSPRISGTQVEVSRRIVENDELLGTIYLRAHYDIAGRVYSYIGIFGAIIALSLLAALLLSNKLQRIITDPLESMADVARRIVQRRDYSFRAARTTDDEIGLVVDAFNRMLDEVQSRARALERSNAALMEEVSTRQAAEAALARANARLESTMQALREADRRKDEFLATLAHELRNPLAPIGHAVKILEVSVADQRQREWAREVIARQSRRMALLLDDLLDVSRITSGRLKLRRDVVALDTLVATAVETAKPLIESKGHSLMIELPPDRIELEVDPLRLSQALSNLLANAAKYTDPGGKIGVRIVRQSHDLLIAVRDSGIGLSAASIPGVFEMFSQVESAIDRAEGGLGIGLALVRGLVELHGGRVEAQSAGLGCGSEFMIHLPASVIRSAGLLEAGP